MKNITYLLGAGASANALPTNKAKTQTETLAHSFLIVANDLNFKRTAIHAGKYSPEIKKGNQDFCLKLCNDLEMLNKQSKLFGTVDTFAKFLHSKKQWGELNRLKKTLSFYFIYQQIINKRFDDRSLVFLTTIMEKGPKFPDNVKILSWNYDSQIQIAALNFRKETITQQQKHTSLIRYIPSLFNGRDSDEYDMVQLNGTAGLKYLDNGTTLSPYFDFSEKACDINDLIQWKIMKDNDDDLLTFAWEEDEREHFESLGSTLHNDTLKFAKKIAQETEILVIIGYSFPFFNRKHDNTIMEAMLKSGKLTKIYFQDPVLNGNFMREQFNFRNYKAVQIEHISNCDNYFVPLEL